MKDEIILKINPKTAEINIVENSIKKDKSITVEQLFDCLKQSVSFENKPTLLASETFLLSDNVKLLGYKVSSSGKDKTYCIFEDMSNKLVNLNYCKHIINGVILPNILFIARTRKDILSDAFITCTFENNINKNTMLYRFPFPNVFANTKICWGSNGENVFTKCTGENISKFLSMFLYMESSEHCFDINNSCKSVRTFYDILDKEKKVDIKYMKKYKTFEEWFNEL